MSLRIRRIQAGPGVAFRTEELERPSGAGNGYAERLVKLIPAEVTALYLAGKPLAVDYPAAWALVCLLLVVVVRGLTTREAGKGPQWIAIAVAAVSFVLWVAVESGTLLHLPNIALPQNAPQLAIMLFTFLVPLFYKGD